MDNKEVVATLNDLIETCKDGEQGFLTCADDVTNLELKAYFTSRAARCADAAEELQELVITYGGTPETTSHVSGALHRRWVDIRSLITGKSEEAVLEECERGEDIAKRNYEDALAKALPDEVRRVVEAQYNGVRHNHDQVKNFRDQARAQR